MPNEVLIDSNVYIDLLRSRRDPIGTLYDWAEELGRSLVVCGMVRLEVLRGITAVKARERISSLMDVMVNVPSDNRLWQAAADLGWEMDRKGKVIPGPDLVIGASALRIGAAVLTSDAHFKSIEGLQVYAPPQEWFT